MGPETSSNPFSDEQIALASANYEAQEWLVRQLADAFKMSERTLDELADELGLTTDEAASWICGDTDLTLSELRQLANCIDAKVSYRVGAIKTRWIRKFEEIDATSMWDETPWFADPAMHR